MLNPANKAMLPLGPEIGAAGERQIAATAFPPTNFRAHGEPCGQNNIAPQARSEHPCTRFRDVMLSYLMRKAPFLSVDVAHDYTSQQDPKGEARNLSTLDGFL